MAIRKKNFIKKKMNQLKAGFKNDLKAFMKQGSLAEAIEKYKDLAKVDMETARKMVVALSTEDGRTDLLQEAVGLSDDVKKELMEFLAQGETMAAVEACCLETGLDADTAKTVLVALKNERPDTLALKAQNKLQSLQDRAKAEVQDLIAEGNMVEAIKKLRDDPEVDINLANKILQELQAELAPVAVEEEPTADPVPEKVVEKVVEQLPQEARKEVVDLLGQGKPVSAVSKVKEVTGAGTVAAHKTVEYLRFAEKMHSLEKSAQKTLLDLENQARRTLDQMVRAGDRLTAQRFAQAEAGISQSLAKAVVEAAESAPPQAF